LLFSKCQNNKTIDLSNILEDTLTISDNQDYKKSNQNIFTSQQKNKIIGTIKFGDSKKVFDKKKAEFIKKSKNKDSEILIDNDPRLGNYIFSEVGMVDLYDDDKIYWLRIIGRPIQWEDYNSLIPDQINALKEVIVQQYGNTDDEHEVIDRLNIEEGYNYNVYGWNIGNKRLEIQVVEKGYYYYVDLLIFDSEVNNRIEKQLDEKKSKNTADAKGAL